MMNLPFRTAALVVLAVWPVVAASGAAKVKSCKCFPGETCWPSEATWDSFNATVGGRLIKTVPLGSPCHDPSYNETECAKLQANWRRVPIHLESSSSIQAPIFANASCDPFTPRSSPCLMGNYVHYAVNVTGPEDIAATIRFSDQHHIRLVIRNTGHDYMGRSTGAGSLGIWTHHLKSVEVIDWASEEYNGIALKIGAGVEGHEVLKAAAAAGLVVTTGECPTVGVAGGYVQSGGHSPLSTALGLGADQTLEFEVVTADGKLVTASPAHNADLFWALSGSGSGNFGVVASLTMKASPDAVTSGASFTIQEHGRDHSIFLNAWHEALPDIIDSGIMATYLAEKTVLSAPALTAFNRTRRDVKAALTPFITKMADMGITLTPNYTEFASYHTHYSHYFGPIPDGVFGAAGEYLIGGRLLPRDSIQSIGGVNNETLQLGAGFIGQSMNVSRFDSPTRAVLPQWRSSLIMSAYYFRYSFKVPFEEMQAQQNFITEQIMPKVETVTHGAGAYINEADFQQPDWQNTFFGDNYDRLLKIKRRYDPKGLFYNPLAVGSERWEVLHDGRMCEARKCTSRV